jgi:tetratricopeptide (TPR) repeat protein
MLKQVFIVFLCSFISLSVTCQPPKNAMALYKKGISQRDNGLYTEALNSFKQATLLYKKYDSAWLEMGNLYIKLNNADTAVTFYKRAIAANPRNLLAYTTTGNFYRDNRQNLDSALKYYFGALKLDSANKVTCYSIAWCYNSKMDYDNALIYAIKATEIDNDYRAAYGEMGHAYHLSKRFNDAIVQFRKNIARSEIDLPRFYLGMVYLELKQKDSALKMVDELKRVGSKMADGLKKRIDMAKE